MSGGNEEWKMEKGERVSDISGLVLVLLDRLISKHTAGRCWESRDIWRGGVKGRSTLKRRCGQRAAMALD